MIESLLLSVVAWGWLGVPNMILAAIGLTLAFIVAFFICVVVIYTVLLLLGILVAKIVYFINDVFESIGLL